jgi:hypothetical protein
MVSSIALIVTAIGVLGVMFGLRQNYRERLRQFEEMYVERYWRIVDQLSLDALKALRPAQVCPEDEKAIRTYILLCEDELQLRASGYISDGTYKVWAEAIHDQLSQPMFKEVWTQIEEEAKEHRTFPYEYMRRFLDGRDPEAADPLSMSLPGRWLRGLAGPRGV